MEPLIFRNCFFSAALSSLSIVSSLNINVLFDASVLDLRGLVVLAMASVLVFEVPPALVLARCAVGSDVASEDVASEDVASGVALAPLSLGEDKRL
mmetsp:Transcript_24824/g.36409  ORF Transcript_24824/g.36409 Transcript_24824/m.36409 type:complete len:96 (+) Transcript_24824:1547-1834(+)